MSDKSGFCGAKWQRTTLNRSKIAEIAFETAALTRFAEVVFSAG
jgi:hypothetical protein